MQKKEPGQRACKLCVSIPADMMRQVDDILASKDPLAPNRSMIIQAALKDWLEANAEQYADYDKEGNLVSRTRLRGDSRNRPKEGQPSKRRFEDVMGAF